MILGHAGMQLTSLLISLFTVTADVIQLEEASYRLIKNSTKGFGFDGRS